MLDRLRHKLNNQHARDEIARRELDQPPVGSSFLDVGYGSQRYSTRRGHLNYFAQDFSLYTIDEQKSLGSDGM